MNEIKFMPLTAWQTAAINNPYTYMCMWGGIASLKTVAGCHFVINQIIQRPNLTGLIACNNYDQLSLVFLRELFKFLDEYGFEYVIDKIPPQDWDTKRKFKKYNNVLTIRNPWTNKVSTVFTKTLSEPDALRGLTLSWFVIDETRDTTEYAFDIILSRLRESNYIKGLVCTTTNGQDWVYKRFYVNSDKKMYGSMHIETIESVKAGIITQEFYNSLLASYSPLMAEQELFAKHVNIQGGRAYYALSNDSKTSIAPWGDFIPNRNRPLIVGCDFNFAPAPCVWEIGQLSPTGESIHWFKELSITQASTTQMAMALISQFPDYTYRIYGDASGNRGTTSNAGETDYNQISEVLSNAGCIYSIDVDQANPRVKDRIEVVNGLLKNALGEIRMTYDSNGCPLLDGDFNIVGWRQVQSLGKLDDTGDHNRTHASDAIGYACFKLFPPGRKAFLVPSGLSEAREEINDLF